DIYLNTEYKDKIVFMSGEDIIYNIKNIESKISCLNEKISIYSDDNKMVKILRYIVDNTSELTHYQQSHEKCPLCGNGETFKESQIGEVARQVLGENDIERQSINYQIKNLKDEAIHEIKKLKECLIETIDKNLYNLNRNLNEKQYIDEINNLLKILNLEYDEDLIINLKSKITNNFINEIESKEKKLISYINSKEYSFLSDMKSELLYENYEKLSLYNRLKVIDSVISRFNINIPNTEIHYRIINKDELDNRIAICNSYIEKLKSNELLNFIEVNEKNKEIKEHQLEIMDKKIENIKKMIKKVKKVRTNDEINQTELIQKPLEYIYRKITRNTNIKKIELIRGKAEGRAELDIVDLSNKKTSFANIMSAGQLSTLSISIFLAKAYLNSENNVKLYLMDEPIQTMDDLNILSFVDLMKYQLAKDNHKSFIDQVIFSTCDENLSRLFKYKFNSFDIPVCEYKFEGNSKFTKI
ncbi:hypothetical protein, partial [Paraclostridium sordellii]|uniref:hypothetical protein n=1 Tax=Paraclostridium sordellii TaxID=1505 RepID=UPI002ED4B4FD